MNKLKWNCQMFDDRNIIVTVSDDEDNFSMGFPLESLRNAFDENVMWMLIINSCVEALSKWKENQQEAKP